MERGGEGMVSEILSQPRVFAITHILDTNQASITPSMIVSSTKTKK